MNAPPATSPILNIPFDLVGIGKTPRWREDLVWPVSPQNLGEMYKLILSEYLALIRSLSGSEQRTAILAMAPVISIAMSTFEVALYADAEVTTGIRVEGSEPEFKFLRGETNQIPAPRMPGLVKKIITPRLPIRRNMQVTSWWTPWTQMARTMIRPEAVAVGESPLLIFAARHSQKRIAFRHGGIFLREARRRNAVPKSGISKLAALVNKQLLAGLSVGAEVKQRVTTLLELNSVPLFERVSSDLEGLRQAPKLPDEIWSGTAAKYPTRGIGLEVIRRGGSVVRFDHGGTIGMTNYPEVTAALELLATTRHVLPTDHLAANVRSSGAPGLLPADQKLEIVGQPRGVRTVKPRTKVSRSSGHRKVVYCSTLLLGFRRMAYTILPDPLSLDWTLRIAEALAEMPIDLLCKPHPEGVLQGREHPVSQIAETSYRLFEKEIDSADLFVFDRCHSTAFWIATRTDRPVVYLEATPPALHPDIQDAMERRCRILRATFDDRNRPQIDPGAFREAVLGGEARVDPAELSALFHGKAA